MKDSGAPLWSIEELGAEVARALSTGYAGASSGRVRDVPDLRTIRYYTTLGLIDRPAEMRGRTALYGPRHLLQLVAIKKMQARGLSLARVQEQLVGASDVMLRRLADVAPDAEGDASGARRLPQGKTKARSFWKSRPVEFSKPATSESGTTRPNPVVEERSGQVAKHQEMDLLQAIGLANQVTLLLAPTRRIDPGEFPAIRQAAAPLIRHLEKHRLIPPCLKGESDDCVDSTTD
jgi:DNA-binding transcriptional MerR regulator